jgi:Zn-dependent M28 family amino/carboxypeptidase
MISTWGLARYGSTIPVVSISYEDGEFLRRLLSEDRITLSMRIDTDLKKSKGTHVIGVARGEKWPQEVSVLCAHRESVPSSPGANDNASGVAVVLEVMKALTSYRPKRTIWALLSTGEEGGGIGIRAFVAENKAKMESVRAAIDVDVVGQGANLCVFTEGRWPDRTVTTSDGPNNVLVEAASDLGYCLVRSASPMGLGDTEGFIEAGIPGAWLGREMKEMGHIHTAKDLPETIDINSLKVAADILLIALLRLDQRVTLDDL